MDVCNMDLKGLLKDFKGEKTREAFHKSYAGKKQSAEDLQLRLKWLAGENSLGSEFQEFMIAMAMRIEVPVGACHRCFTKIPKTRRKGSKFCSKSCKNNFATTGRPQKISGSPDFLASLSRVQAKIKNKIKDMRWLDELDEGETESLKRWVIANRMSSKKSVMSGFGVESYADAVLLESHLSGRTPEQAKLVVDEWLAMWAEGQEPPADEEMNLYLIKEEICRFVREDCTVSMDSFFDKSRLRKDLYKVEKLVSFVQIDQEKLETIQFTSQPKFEISEVKMVVEKEAIRKEIGVSTEIQKIRSRLNAINDRGW